MPDGASHLAVSRGGTACGPHIRDQGLYGDAPEPLILADMTASKMKMSGRRATRLASERRLIELACRAPSIHNTQPWLWRIRPGVIELYADRSRQLTVADPVGRNLLISCGAAFHHARVAAAGTGFGTVVEYLLGGPDADRLAIVRLSPAPVTPEATDQLIALERRRTDRRRFTSWPIPDERLAQLAHSVTTDGVIAIPLTDLRQRLRTEVLADQAMRFQADDPRFDAEQTRWIGGSGDEGIPLWALVPFESGYNDTPSRFVGPRTLCPPNRERASGSDGVIALASIDDDPVSWFHCGEALSALWLTATIGNLSIVPLSQVIEVEETRRSLEHDVLGRAPQILLRVGWQEISRGRLPPTPRRPVDDVLLG